MKASLRYIKWPVGILVAVIVLTFAEFGISSLHGKPYVFPNKPADQAALRAEYASESWSADIAGANWDTRKEGLYLESSTTGQTAVLAMCNAMAGDVNARFPGPVGGLMVFSEDGTLLADLNGDRCYWR